jgi:NAD+ diphosphatase
MTSQDGRMSGEDAGDRELYFAFRGRHLLVMDAGGELRLPDAQAWAALGVRPVRTNHLVGEDGFRHLAVELPEDADAPAGAGFHNLRQLYTAMGEQVYRAAARAVQVMEWDRTHQFCGRCGTATERVDGELAKRCPACGLTAYPRISPAVIVRIERGDRVLLARGPLTPPGMYSHVAGFVEPGETLEEAVAREVMEEVGIRVANIRYFGSQPWPFPHSLMVGFVADWAGGELKLQAAEIEDAGWFSVDEMPIVSSPLSIARTLLDDWVIAQGGDPSSLRTL